MKRKLATIGLAMAGMAIAVFLWVQYGGLRVTSDSTDAQYDHAESLKVAMNHMGYDPTTLIGTHWRGKGCREFSYLLDAGGQRLFFFTRDAESGVVTATLTRDQVDAELHRYISFEGSFGNSTLAFDDLGELHYIGQVPDKERADVYIRINKQECGVHVDRVAYRGPLGTKVVRVNVQLVPGK